MKKNIANNLHKAKMKTKCRGPYTIVEASAMRGYKLKDKRGHILKTHFPLKQVRRYFQGIPTDEYDEDDVCEYVDKSMAT